MKLLPIDKGKLLEAAYGADSRRKYHALKKRERTSLAVCFKPKPIKHKKRTLPKEGPFVSACLCQKKI